LYNNFIIIAMEKDSFEWGNFCLHPASLCAGNIVELLSGGEQSFPAMLAAIENARSHILLEIYTFGDDPIGHKFRNVLENKAKEGVKIFLIYDALGSLSSSGGFFEHMARAGINVVEYHPLVPWKPHWNWFRRNHRKLLVIDGRTAFVGGQNLSEDDGPRSWGGRGWRDTQAQLSGPIVKEISALFWEDWTRYGKTITYLPARDDLAAPAGGNAVSVSVVSSSGLRNRRSIRRSYKYAISKAQKYIYITNAYFLPGRTIYRRLIKAAQRGVRVVIITPSQTDHPYVRWASWALYPALLKFGIEIYEWQTSVLHSKTAVIDGVWSSVGSHNLDHRSLHYNLEINVNILGAEFGHAMKRMFEDDLRTSKRITLEECRRQRFLFKAASRVLYWMRYWL